MFKQLSDVTNINISILMPIYTGVECLKDSISSILSQTYEHWELIIGVYGYPKFGKVYQSILNIVSTINETQRKKITVIDLYPIKSRSNALHDIITYYISPQSSHIVLHDVHDIWEPNKLLEQLVSPGHTTFIIKKTDAMKWKPKLENSDDNDG